MRAEISLCILARLTAMLGQDEYMEEKIANLRAILKKMGNAERDAAFGELYREK